MSSRTWCERSRVGIRTPTKTVATHPNVTRCGTAHRCHTSGAGTPLRGNSVSRGRPRVPQSREDGATQVFTDHRELLFSVVYNLLGSVADTDDVLQDTWLAWTARDRTAEVINPRAYLVRIAVNTALTRQAGISRRRETYVG